MSNFTIPSWGTKPWETIQPWLTIPTWLGEVAPGAADAARNISTYVSVHQSLTDVQRARLARLVGNDPAWATDMQSAWDELAIWRGKEQPSEAEQLIAQYELFSAAYRAPDLPQVSMTGFRERKEELAIIGTQVADAARALRGIVAEDAQVAMQLDDVWRLYRFKHRDDPVVASLPDHFDFNSAVGMVERLAYFVGAAAKGMKRFGPAPLLGKARGENAQQRTAIRHIAEVCERHFGSHMIGTVTKLVNAGLGRNDIGEETVRSSLPRKRKA